DHQASADQSNSQAGNPEATPGQESEFGPPRTSSGPRQFHPLLQQIRQDPRRRPSRHASFPGIGARDGFAATVSLVPSRVSGPARVWAAAETSGEEKPEEAAKAGFVGMETCANCHTEVAEAFKKNPHGKTSRTNWEGTAGCETCHGPGAAHAEEGDKSKIR